MRPTRRELLEALGLGAAGAAVGCGPKTDWPAPRRGDPTAEWAGAGEPDEAIFDLGVQSGDPRPDALLLWTHTTGAADMVAVVKVWDGTAWADHDEVTATASEGGYVHVDVTGLEADLPVAFQFRDADGKLSAVGRSRTALAVGQEGTVRFGATSCADHDHAPFPSMTSLVERGEMDFFLWLGDTVYADRAYTLDEYRDTWRANQQTQGFRDVLTRAPSIYVWDDHEVANDWNTEPVSEQRLADATQAYLEHTTLRVDEQGRMWRSYRFGRAVEVFVLDCRGERDYDAGEYVSPEQLQWLIDGLQASDATWKVVVNSVPIANLPGAYDVLDKHLDRWEGFPAQRTALLDAITGNGVTGVLFVSGDFHQCTLARVEPEGHPANGIFDAFVGPAGSTLNAVGRLLMGDPQFPWSDADWNCTRFELAPEGIGRITWVADDGTTLADAWIDVTGELLHLDYLQR